MDKKTPEVKVKVKEKIRKADIDERLLVPRIKQLKGGDQFHKFFVSLTHSGGFHRDANCQRRKKEKKVLSFSKNNEGDSPGSLGSIFSKNGDTSWATASTKLIFQCSAGFLKAKPRAFRVTDAGFRARDLNSSTASKMEEETFESLVGNLMLSSTIKPGCEQTLCFLSK